MKKLFLISIVIFLSGSLLAGNGDLFTYDVEEVQTELSSVTNLEQYVGQNQGVSLDLMKEKDHPLVVNVASTANVGSALYGPWGVPAFVWGFCFGPFGLAFVYFMMEDSYETKLAIYGCVAWLIWPTIYRVFRGGWY